MILNHAVEKRALLLGGPLRKRKSTKQQILSLQSIIAGTLSFGHMVALHESELMSEAVRIGIIPVDI
jgi:hypothetical protein